MPWDDGAVDALATQCPEIGRDRVEQALNFHSGDGEAALAELRREIEARRPRASRHRFAMETVEVEWDGGHVFGANIAYHVVHLPGINGVRRGRRGSFRGRGAAPRPAPTTPNQ